jgi:hypothetical protein
MKRVGTLFALMLVLVLSGALGYGWGISDTTISDTGPWQMHISYQGIYVQAAADGYALDLNKALVAERLSYLCQTDGSLNLALEEADARYGSDPVKAKNLDALRALIRDGVVKQNTDVPNCQHTPVNVPPYMTYSPFALGGLAVIVAVLGILSAVRSSEEAPSAPSRPAGASAPASAPAASSAPAGGEAPAASVERSRATLTGFGPKPPAPPPESRSAASAGAKISSTVEKTDFGAAGSEPPVVQFMTTYLQGDDLYDDSFSIETSSGDFLGETGMGISETLSGIDGKRVSAFEVWLFDKNDIRTVTKVLMSNQAFNDDAVRARLAPKGEAVLATPGERMTLETASLRVQARIVDLSYIAGGVPPESAFERITIELAAWKRSGPPPAPAGGGGLSSAPGSGMGGGLPGSPGGGMGGGLPGSPGGGNFPPAPSGLPGAPTGSSPFGNP